ncbi:AMP-binding protein [Rugamonas sp. FT29W]|uniref:AMP-binding protein n=1 Tax=Rugamonas aquatica TaxID=2743357 RepID=A0A6A7MW21_9BURK|nr:AMP-binding protein [Rugamonas aquatica]
MVHTSTQLAQKDVAAGCLPLTGIRLRLGAAGDDLQPLQDALRRRATILGAEVIVAPGQLQPGALLATLGDASGASVQLCLRAWPQQTGGSAALLEAASGMTAWHQRASGEFLPLGIDYLATLGASLAMCAGVATLLTLREHGGHVGLNLNLAECALFAMNQYLAMDHAGQIALDRNRADDRSPPFASGDGIRFELEALSAESWRAFWQAAGAEPDDVRRGWAPFMQRYTQARAFLPAGLFRCAGTHLYEDLQTMAAQSGVTVCALHQAASVASDDPERERWMHGGPWQFEPVGAASPALAARRCEGSPALPLAGFSVLESCRLIQGPLAGHLLHRLGADVVKVEMPGGDPMRALAPLAGNISAHFAAINQGKTSLELDLKAADGRQRLLDLATKADVFLHNWAPGRAAQLGLTAADLARTCPTLIYASASGTGQSPQPDDPVGTDFMIQAHSGVASLLRTAEGQPQSGTLLTIIDVLGGAATAEGIVAALYARASRGQVLHLDSAMAGAAAMLVAAESQSHQRALGGCADANTVNRLLALPRGYATSDGWLMLDRITGQDAASYARRLAASAPDADLADDFAQALQARSSADNLQELRRHGMQAEAVAMNAAEVIGHVQFAGLANQQNGLLQFQNPWTISPNSINSHIYPTMTNHSTASSANVTDMVDAKQRQAWADAGIYKNLDLFASFLQHCNERPQSIAVCDQDESLSYAALRARSLSLATALARLNVGSGDVVAVNLPNGWRGCAADMAAAALGAIVLPFPLGRKAHESRLILRKSRAKVLICQRQVGDADYAALIDGIRADLPELQAVLVHGTQYGDWGDLDAAWDQPAYDYRAGTIDPNGAARLIASSGSESEPKLIAYSHNNLLGGQANYLTSLGARPADMRALFCVPLASPFGSLGTSCALAAFGGTLINCERFQPEQVLHLAARREVTHMFAGPNMVDMLLNCELLQGDQPFRLPALKAIVSGGSALSAETARRVRTQIGCALIQSYGSADGVACHTALEDDFDTTVNTVGIPDSSVVTVRIVDEQGQPLPPQQEGEIWALGPMTPMGYFGAPDLDSRYRDPEGWVKTGDRGMLDENGRLRIVGRRADTVVRSGIKLNLPEIENLLHGHASIADAVLLPVATSTQLRLHACLVLRGGATAPDMAALNHYLLNDLGLERYKSLDSVSYHEQFPIAPSGKVDKAALLKHVHTEAEPRPAGELSAQSILEILTGVERAGVLRAAIQLGVFDLLASGPKTSVQLAQESGANARGMRVLLDALAGLKLLAAESPAKDYALTPQSQRFLVRSSAYYVGGLSQVYTDDLMWETFRDFKAAVVAGQSVLPASLEIANHPYWEQYAAGIQNTSRTTAARVSGLLKDWRQGEKQLAILDLACSSGIYGFTVAQQFDDASVCGVDWPASRPKFEAQAQEFGMAERSSFVAADLFELSLPDKYDLVIMSQILHHFDTAHCRELLARARACLKPGGRLVLCDFMLSEAAPHTETMQRLFGAQMLGLTSAGECYRADFFQDLLRQQGFQTPQLRALKGLPVHCILADLEP